MASEMLPKRSRIIELYVPLDQDFGGVSAAASHWIGMSYVVVSSIVYIEVGNPQCQ